jgi:hypothetical protein
MHHWTSDHLECPGRPPHTTPQRTQRNATQRKAATLTNVSVLWCSSSIFISLQVCTSETMRRLPTCCTCRHVGPYFRRFRNARHPMYVIQAIKLKPAFRRDLLLGYERWGVHRPREFRVEIGDCKQSIPTPITLYSVSTTQHLPGGGGGLTREGDGQSVSPCLHHSNASFAACLCVQYRGRRGHFTCTILTTIPKSHNRCNDFNAEENQKTYPR